MGSLREMSFKVSPSFAPILLTLSPLLHPLGNIASPADLEEDQVFGIAIAYLIGIDLALCFL